MKATISKKVIIFSAPSGSGKTTIVRHLLEKYPQLSFSVSATNRAMRNGEKNGEDYYFLTNEEFKSRLKNDEFVEFEEVYEGRFYGTLKSEAERIWNSGKIIVFDVDVWGGMRLKEIYGEQAISVFVMPPSIAELKKRLMVRATETISEIDKRMARAQEEISYADKFDEIIINNYLKKALKDAENIVGKIIKSDVKK